jgi:hypothetical protein
MLNQNDRRRLEEIERRLRAEDPEFARRFTQVPPPPTGRSRFWPVLVFVVGVLGMLTSLLAPLPAVFLLSVAAMATGWIWMRRLGRVP